MSKSQRFLVIALLALVFGFGGVSAFADITTSQFGAGHVFDTQRSPAFPVANTPFMVSNFADPYRADLTHYTLTNGEYVRLFFVGGKCVDGNVGINRYSAGGVLLETVQPSGHVYGLSPQGFLHDSGTNIGTFFSTSPNSNGGSLTYTPTTGPAPETCATLGAANVVEVPTLDRWGLGLLALVLAAGAAFFLQRRGLL